MPYRVLTKLVGSVYVGRCPSLYTLRCAFVGVCLNYAHREDASPGYDKGIYIATNEGRCESFA